ncbi:MAG: TIGR03067 domain-containing protein [Gemmataceae bacterium]
MRLTFASAVLFAAAAGLTAAPVPKEKKDVKDEDAIQGSWKIESFDAGGNGPGAPPKEMLDQMRFVFKKDGKLSVGGGPGGQGRDGEYKLDPAAKPKTIDLISDGRTAPGIYELDGDTFKLCMSEGQNAIRPTEFKAGGMRTVVVTFKRVKDEEKKEEKKDK